MAATPSGATNCAPRAALNTEPTAVVRSRVGNSSANMGPKLDHVPVPKPTSQRQRRRRGGHPTIAGQRSVIETSPAAMRGAERLKAGLSPKRYETQPNEAERSR